MEMELVIERLSTNKLAKAEEQKREIAGACLNRATAGGVQSKAGKLLGPIQIQLSNNEIKYRYEFTVHLSRETSRSEQAAEKAMEAARKFVERAAEGRGWVIKGEAAELAEQ